MHTRRFLGIAAVALLAACGFAADRDLEISYSPLFLSVSQPASYAPFKIRCENKGKNTKGVFTVSNGDSRTRYPVDLPKGSRKEFIVYMPPSSYEATYGTLETDIGTAKVKFPERTGTQNCLISISNTDGILNFAKSLQASRANAMALNFSPMSARPSDLPDRATGYLSASAVVLGDGAERISEDAFRALERYLLIGGTIVVNGGASTPIFNDPKWQHLLPILNPRPETINPNPGETIGGLELQSEFTMSVGRVAPGAIVKSRYRSHPFVVTKPFGFGRVVFVALNAFEDPVTKWPGKGDLIASLNLSDTSAKIAGLQAAAMMTRQDNSYPYGGAAYPASPYSTPDSSDPFSASVPPTSTVVWILILYFVLVVPLNLLILRKMGRGEFAWVTSPILSLGFAAIFFQFAAGLYSADLSTATTGVVISDQHSKLSYFMGGSQMFFPRGGKYDLKLADVEGIEPRMADPYGHMYGGSQGRGLNDFEPVDTGRIQVQDLSVSNLSFKEFSFYEALEGEWITVISAGSNAIRITNRSGKGLENATVFFKGGIATAGNFKPGESREVKLVNTGQVQIGDGAYYNGISISDMVAGLAKSDRFAVTADLKDFRPGPQIGNLVPNLTRLRLVWFGSQGAR